MSRIQSKDHKIETYKINKIFFMIKYTSKTMDVID